MLFSAGFIFLFSFNPWIRPKTQNTDKIVTNEIIIIIFSGLRASNYVGSFDLLRSYLIRISFCFGLDSRYE